VKLPGIAAILRAQFGREVFQFIHSPFAATAHRSDYLKEKK
jgi:hypothetical protein